MAYESVDRLQNVLAKEVFHYATDAKKAAGRALGTLVEIITFYMLKSWGFEHSIAIERRVPEYGNPEVTHNVEYSLHPILGEESLTMDEPRFPITSARILARLREIRIPDIDRLWTSNKLLTESGILRNSCTLGRGSRALLVATLDSTTGGALRITVVEQFSRPYAIVECKRVGVEEGMKKGPQTIEKAKQGAYVARSVSSLHKFRTASGERRGLIYKSGDVPYSRSYADLVAEIMSSEDPELLRGFILTIGVVSNHGNWFTSNDHNKEIKVLEQSYDWLLFLTDQGLAEFITELLLEPKPLLQAAKEAFLISYGAGKKKNRFTKVQMDYRADQVLQTYFRENSLRVGGWFNVIGPPNLPMSALQSQLSALREKNWREVHSV